MENTNNGIKTWQWVVTVIVVIVLIVIGIIVFSNKGTVTPVTTENQPATTTPTNTVNGLIMADQYPGNVAYVSSVQLSNPGWVVMQTNIGGNPGAIIGSTYVPAGISPYKVNLTQPMIDGQMYFAVLYSDNGNQKFDPNTDKPLTNATGDTIMKPFKATVSANAEVKG